MNHFHAAQMVFNQPLLIEERRKETITDFLLSRMRSDAPLPQAFDDDDGPMVRNRTYHRIADVAIIPVCGTLVHRQFGLEALCGMTSYQTLASMLTQALEDSRVKKILFDIDSGGGQVAGLFDLVEMITEARAQKTIWAFSNENCYSAAYAIGSAAEKLFVSRTSGVGSVGVVMQHVDFSQLNEASGVKVTMVYAGDRKIDWNPNFPISQEALATAQKEVNDVYDIFVETVGENRGIDPDEVRATQAGLFFGEDAVQIKLADDVSSFDAVLESLISIGTAVETPVNSKMGKLKMRLFGKMAKDKPKAEIVDDEVTAPQDAPATDPVADPAPAEDTDENKEQPPADDPVADPAPAETDKPADAAEVMRLAIDAGQPELAIVLLNEKATMAQVKERLDATKEITRLCAMAKVPNQAADYISKGMTVPMVKDALLKTLAERTEASDVSPTPDPDKVAAATKKAAEEANATNPVMADVERRQKDWEQKNKGAK